MQTNRMKFSCFDYQKAFISNLFELHNAKSERQIIKFT